MFELAPRKKFRFATSKGLVTVEDLWDLPLTSGTGKANLDDIAKDLNKQLRSSDNVSFVNPSASADPDLQARFDIVKHIIDVKMAENKTVQEAAKKAEEKRKLLEILAKKQDQSLENMTEEEIKARIAAL
jgi:CHASE3 domain sensor protein